MRRIVPLLMSLAATAGLVGAVGLSLTFALSLNDAGWPLIPIQSIAFIGSWLGGWAVLRVVSREKGEQS